MNLKISESKTTHKMKLYDDSFQAIKSLTKTVEMRLNDEKRRLIKIGDIIEFINVKNNEILFTRVINIYKYKDFYELYKNHNKISIGYNIDEEANPQDMLDYYSLEDINKYGVLGIEIEVISY